MKNRVLNRAVFTAVLRALALCAVLAAPVLAVPAMSNSGGGTVIEAPAPEKTGMGFVLLVSLQRT